MKSTVIVYMIASLGAGRTWCLCVCERVRVSEKEKEREKAREREREREATHSAFDTITKLTNNSNYYTESKGCKEKTETEKEKPRATAEN